MALVHPGEAPVISPAPVRRLGRARRVTLHALRELVLVLILFELYRLGRLVARDESAAAYDHAGDVHRLQNLLSLPSEAAIQGMVPFDALLQLANVYYVGLHFPAMIAFLVWGYLFRPRWQYLWARNLVIVLTGTALVVHVAYPLAPPRMFPQWGFVDTMAVFGPNAYAGASGDLANQFAAMPSLHVGWAALIAYVVHRTGPRWLAWLAYAHVTLTVLVVVVTANHYWLDGAIAVVLLAAATKVVRLRMPDQIVSTPRQPVLRLNRGDR